MNTPFKDIRNQVATLQLAERFFDSLLLFNLYDLGVFRLLARGAQGFDEIAQAIGGHTEALRGVLDASVATGVLQRDGEGRYSAQPELQACLGDPSSPAFVGEWLTFLRTLVGPVSEGANMVRTGEPSASLRDGAEGDDRPARAMTAAMDAYARTRGFEAVQRLDLAGVRTLMDVGCGPATYSLALLEQHPDLHAILLDLPGPIEEASVHVEARGLGERVTLAPADAFTYQPDREVDLLLISNMLHMLGPELSRSLIQRCGVILRPGARLVVQAQFLDPERTSPRWATLLNLIQLTTTEGGRNHTIDETEAWMREAGFDSIEHQPLSPWNVNSLLIGVRA